MNANNEPNTTNPAVTNTPPTSQGVGGTPPTKSNGPVGLSDDLLARAVALFGKAEAMSCQATSLPGFVKKLFDDEVGAPEDYFHKFIGVTCDATTNLCAIVVPLAKLANLKLILKETHWLSSTVMTSWQKLAFIWFRVEGARPGNCKLPDCCLWISQGLLPAVANYGPHTYPHGFPVCNWGKIVKQIKFSEFKWHESLHEAFLLLQTEEKFGRLIQLDGLSNQPILNLPTASRFLIKRMELQFVFQTDGFIITDDSGKRVPRTREDMACVIEDWLSKKAATLGITRFDDTLVQGLINTIIKHIAIGEEEALRMFLSQCVERRPGSSVTMSEMCIAYQDYCNGLGAAVLPPRAFYRQVTVAIQQRLGVAKSHDIRRCGPDGKETAKAGYRNISFKRGSPDASDGSDASDRSDALGKTPYLAI